MRIRDFKDNDNWFGLGLIVPVLLFFIVWNVIPLLWMLGLSFYNYIITLGLPPRFVGLQNYGALLASQSIWHDIGKTFLFVLVSVLVETIIGAIIGYLIWQRPKLFGRRLALTLLFAPMIMAPLAVGTFFRLVYDPLYGIVPYYMHVIFGIPAPNLLGHSLSAFVTLLVTEIWMWTPFMILMTLAALGAVPKAMMEASLVDRLTFSQKVRYILWPTGRFILILGILLSTIDTFKTYGLVAAMTSGGPGSATELLSIHLYRSAFTNFNMGSSSALAIFSLLAAIAFTSMYLFILRYNKKEGIL